MASGDWYYARGNQQYGPVSASELKALADRIEARVGPFGYRVFTDSAPVLEVELATRRPGVAGGHGRLGGRPARERIVRGFGWGLWPG